MTALKHSAGFLVNFRAAIISSMTELQNVVNQPKSWLCGRLQVGAARNSFSEIMDKMNVIMGTVPLICSKCTTCLEKGSSSALWIE